MQVLQELIKGFEGIVYSIAGCIMAAGFILICYVLTVMFDDKRRYDGGIKGFIKWIKDSCIPSEEEVKALEEGKEKQED